MAERQARFTGAAYALLCASGSRRLHQREPAASGLRGSCFIISIATLHGTGNTGTIQATQRTSDMENVYIQLLDYRYSCISIAGVREGEEDMILNLRVDTSS